MADTAQRIEGVAIGVLMGFEGDAPLVVFPGNPRDVCRAGAQPGAGRLRDDRGRGGALVRGAATPCGR